MGGFRRLEDLMPITVEQYTNACITHLQILQEKNNIKDILDTDELISAIYVMHSVNVSPENAALIIVLIQRHHDKNIKHSG